MKSSIFFTALLLLFSCADQPRSKEEDLIRVPDDVPVHSKLLDSLVKTIDDNYDPLHTDYTPSVHALSSLGLPAIKAVLPVLNSPKSDTRLHAQRVVEGVIYRM